MPLDGKGEERDLGFLTWSNDLAWMESQKGKRW
jgi:hypothetical protein